MDKTANTKESWSLIDQTDGRYSVSNHGRVRNNGFEVMRNGRWGRHAMKIASKMLSPSPDANGYAVVNISYPHTDGQTKVYVHRLVGEAFLPKAAPDKTQIAHWDGGPMNANFLNLRWVSQSENEKDKVRHKRARYTPSGSRVFSPAQITEMRKAVLDGESFRSISRRVGHAHNTIKNALVKGAAPEKYRRGS